MKGGFFERGAEKQRTDDQLRPLRSVAQLHFAKGTIWNGIEVRCRMGRAAHGNQV